MLAALLLMPGADARAQFMQCEKLSADQQEQAEFCAAHLSCRIAVNLLKACTDVTDAVRKFYDSMGKSSERIEMPVSERDRKEQEQARTDAMADGDRKQAYKACLARRGDSGKEFCFDAFSSSDEQAAQRAAERARYANRDWKREERDAIRQFMEEDRVLRNEMLDLQCDRAAPPDPADCSRLGQKALDLQRRLERFKDETRSRRMASEPGPAMPELYTLAAFTVDDNGRIVYKLNALSPSAAAPTTAPAAPADAAAIAALPRRASQPELEAVFSQAIAYADTHEGPRAAAAYKADDDAKAAAQRAAQQERAAAEQQRVKEQLFSDAMQKGSVGELYALADQLESEGQADASRKAYRAVVTRFPDHPLAATAANRLGALSGGAPQRPAGSGAVAAGDGAECTRQEAALVAETNRLTAGMPANASVTSSLQMVMLVTSEAIALFDGACRNRPNAKQERDGNQAAFDSAKKSCAAISTSPEQYCVPRAPW